MIKCIAVDDEPRALEIMQEYINDTPYLELLATFRNPKEAFQYVMDNEVDLLFLDINMPKMTGMQFIKSLPIRPYVILTTAYSEYAVEGFGLEVTDYLLKPIEFGRFQQAASKVYKSLNKVNATAVAKETVSSERNQYLFIKDGHQLRRIDFVEIMFLKGAGNYVEVHTTERMILALSSMTEIMDQLDNQQFVRIHKSYIVNLAKIDSVEHHRINIGEHKLPISENYRELFYEKVKFPR